MKRFVALTMIVLVSLPWAAFPAARADACSMPGAMAVESCTFCAPSGATESAGRKIEAGCCRFQPMPEATPAQAGSVGSTPRPFQTPEAAAIVPGVSAIGEPFDIQVRALHARTESPPKSPPTRTTHLLL